MKLNVGKMKRVLCIFLVCMLVVMPVTPASAATARATTMKLEKTEGTVTLKTQSGTARRITNGMRLYNGYSLTTGKYSYAYVSLDSSKAVKLDQSSSATLRQNGRNLELLVKSGKLFFNVSQPLTVNENMNVRTSTMVTGIRGTCGVVEHVSANTSKLHLLEGKVTLGSGENATTIQGGQTATVILPTRTESGSSDRPGSGDKPGEGDQPGKESAPKIVVEKLIEERIPAVALEVIVNDPVLQKKIEQTTELKIEKIEEAFEKFEKEEAERKEQEKAEQEKENEKDKEQDKDKDKDKETEDKRPEDESQGSSSSGSGGSYVPSVPVIRETVLSGEVTPGAIRAAFQGYDRVHIKGTAMSFAENDSLTIPGGKELLVWGTQLFIPANTTINVGESGSKALFCVPEGQIFSAGNINVTAGSRLEVHGSLKCASLTGGANAMLINNCELTVDGTMKLSSGSTYDNNGVLSGTDLKSDGGATINNTALIKLSGAYTSIGTDTYDDNMNALLISGGTSKNTLPKKLLLTSTIVSAATSGSTTELFASHFNQRVADYLYESSGNGTVTAQFQQKVIVPSNVTVNTKTPGSRSLILDLQANQMCLTSGTLTLGTDVAVTGSATGACIVLDNGSLKLDGNSKENIGVIENTAGGYAIAPSGMNTKGKLIWNDEGRVIKSPEANSVSGIIKGIFKDENDIVHIDSAGYCTFKKDYCPDFDYNSTQMKLEYLPATFSSTDANVNATFDRINKALVNYPVVTVDAPVSMPAEQTVYVPEGKTLKISSTFGVPNKSKIQVSDGATLEVSGTIGGVANGSTTEFGTIIVGNGGSSANLKVASTGCVMADLIELRGGIISNENIIDIGKMTSNGSATITNNALIKLRQAYTSTGSGIDTYTGSMDSVLISNMKSSAMPEGSELVHATTSTADVIKDVQYYYSDYMNARVVDYMNKVKEDTKTTTDITWVFAKDAILPAGNTAAFTGFAADMGTHTLQVEGALTLTDIQTITGSGKAVISVQGAGTLTLGGSESGTISNTNSTEQNYAIAVKDLSISPEQHLFWENENLTISSVKSSGRDSIHAYIIQGCSTDENGDEDGTMISPAWLKCKADYEVKVLQSGVASLGKASQSGSGS